MRSTFKDDELSCWYKFKYFLRHNKKKNYVYLLF